MAALHRIRCRRRDIAGVAHFLTFSCHQRLPLLDRERSRGWVLKAVDLARGAAPFDLWAYVVMVEHVHIVLLPRDGGRFAVMALVFCCAHAHAECRVGMAPGRVRN